MAISVKLGGNGIDTSDANAASSDILSGKTAYVNDEKITGTIPSKAAETYYTSGSNRTIEPGQYLSGTQTIKGVTTSNIEPQNIVSGITVKVGDSANAGRLKNVTGTAEAVSGNVLYTETVNSLHRTIKKSSTTSRRYDFAATSIGSYALFGGGSANWAYVDAYDKSLTHLTSVSALSTGRELLAATTIGSYAIFGGGQNNANQYFSKADAYDTSLTHSTLTALAEARSQLAATSIGSYALFGGGYKYSKYGGGGYCFVVDAYDTSLTRTTAGYLLTTRSQLAATSIGSYALFGGGHGSSYYSTVDAYDTSLTRSTPTSLSAIRSQLAATSIGSYALFGGGYNGSQYCNTVDAYDISLTKSTPAALSVGRYNLAAASIGSYALFGGGYNGSRSSTVDSYNQSLTHSTITNLSEARQEIDATTVGSYAIFGGTFLIDAYIPCSKVLYVA